MMKSTISLFKHIIWKGLVDSIFFLRGFYVHKNKVNICRWHQKTIFNVFSFSLLWSCLETVRLVLVEIILQRLFYKTVFSFYSSGHIIDKILDLVFRYLVSFLWSLFQNQIEQMGPLCATMSFPATFHLTSIYHLLLTSNE